MLNPNIEKIEWTRDSNGAGFAGIVAGQFKAYVLNNGSWAVYRWGNISAMAQGKSPSVVSARSAVKKLLKEIL